jgi:hypothetical protein
VWRVGSEIGREVGHIGPGGRNIAGLHRQKILCGPFAQGILYGLDKVEQLYGFAIADVYIR